MSAGDLVASAVCGFLFVLGAFQSLAALASLVRIREVCASGAQFDEFRGLWWLEVGKFFLGVAIELLALVFLIAGFWNVVSLWEVRP